MKAKSKKLEHGGAREGAGRPRNERKTVTVSFRVFEDEEVYIKEMVKQLLKKKRYGYV